MKKKHVMASLWLGFISMSLFAAPIQRIEVVNLLSNGGNIITQTPVAITFTSKNETSSCFSTTLAYQETLTMVIGAGQACITPIAHISITPVPNPLGFALAYDEQSFPSLELDTRFYLTQMIVNQSISPVFDPSNGSLLFSGTAQVVISNHIK